MAFDPTIRSYSGNTTNPTNPIKTDKKQQVAQKDTQQDNPADATTQQVVKPRFREPCLACGMG